MSLMGVDVGTTGCKASVFSDSGELISQAYREYDIVSENPGWQELDSKELWEKVKAVISEAASKSKENPVTALSVSSFGEGMTPVSEDREILGDCILGLDSRGQEYVDIFESGLGAWEFYKINGNILGHTYSMPKVKWVQKHRPELFDKAYKFLLAHDFVCFMLGCEPTTSYSMANRTLLFDLTTKTWSEKLLNLAGIPEEKLPGVVSSGSIIGTVSDNIADELGLPKGVKVVAGGHDQCCNALGVGVIGAGAAVYGIGTFTCITPAYSSIPDLNKMLENGMNIEDHVVPGLYVSFLYNGTGGSVLKWFRDSLARLDKEQAEKDGVDVYDRLMKELPEEPTSLMVLPHFTVTGPPLFESETRGVISGLTLQTTRGEILKGLLEGVTYYFKEGIEYMMQAGISVDEYRATGGGSKSDVWLQLTADIMGKRVVRPRTTEAGMLGAGMLAGIGTGVYASVEEAVDACVSIERVFEPDGRRHEIYQERMALYRELYPTMKDFLTKLAAMR